MSTARNWWGRGSAPDLPRQFTAVTASAEPLRNPVSVFEGDSRDGPKGAAFWQAIRKGPAYNPAEHHGQQMGGRTAWGEPHLHQLERQ